MELKFVKQCGIMVDIVPGAGACIRAVNGKEVFITNDVIAFLADQMTKHAAKIPNERISATD